MRGNKSLKGQAMYPSLWQILIILLILLVLFGHKRIRELGKSLGEALRDFKKGLDGEEKEQPTPAQPSSKETEVNAGDASSPPESPKK